MTFHGVSSLQQPGLHILAHELARYDKQKKISLENALTQLFPTPTEKKKDNVRSLIEKYTTHKKRYMKNLQFDPQLENLSKFSPNQHILPNLFQLPW